MRNWILFLLIFFFYGCTKPTSNQQVQIGHWGFCFKDGQYGEQFFAKEQFFLFSDRIRPEVAIYNYTIENDTLTREGLTPNTSGGGTKFKTAIDIVSESEIKLSSPFVNFEMKKLDTTIKAPTALVPIEEWIKSVYAEYDNRKASRGCVNQLQGN